MPDPSDVRQLLSAVHESGDANLAHSTFSLAYEVCKAEGWDETSTAYETLVQLQKLES